MSDSWSVPVEGLVDQVIEIDRENGPSCRWGERISVVLLMVSTWLLATGGGWSAFPCWVASLSILVAFALHSWTRKQQLTELVADWGAVLRQHPDITADVADVASGISPESLRRLLRSHCTVTRISFGGQTKHWVRMDVQDNRMKISAGTGG